MEQKIIKFLADNGYKVKRSQIEEIEKINIRNNVNSAGTSLCDYVVRTKIGTFTIVEELVPNRWGATDFSVEKKCILTGVSNYKEETDEPATEDDTTEDL